MEVLRLRVQILLLPVLLSLLCLAWTPPVSAQTAAPTAAAPKSSGQEELPLNIIADRLEVDQNQQLITFINKVVARYKDMILYADQLKIFYQAKKEPAGPEKNTGASQCPPGREAAAPAKSKPAPPGNEASPLGAVGIEKITRIEALGKVKMVQGDRVATGDKAIYYTQEDKLVLQGQPQLWRGDNSLKGHEIVFYLKDNRAIVSGEPSKRVEAVIYPSQKPQLPGKQSATSQPR